MPYSLQAFAFESLLTADKMTQMMDNDEQLQASIIGSGGLFTYNNSGHTHDDTDSAAISLLASSVAQAELKTTTGEVSTLGTANLTLPGGTYGFYPRVKSSATFNFALIADSLNSASYVTNIYLDAGAAETFAQHRYIQASPPYKIGNIYWGHFLFVLREKISKKVISTYEAEDPPWAYNGAGRKDSPERIASVPHPFADYVNKELPSIQEILLLDLRETNVKTWKRDLIKTGKSILEDLDRMNITNVKTFSTFGLPSGISGFTDKIIIRKGSLK
jgi:hypothetical protein